MSNQPSPIAFDQKHASEYDQRFAKLAGMKDALHLLTAAVLGEMPGDARILCVGAGTGAEILYLAEKFPGWTFTAVEPSGPMLDVCRRKAEEQGIAARCVFHEGYLDSLPVTEPFDAALSLLVSHFILDPETRTAFFRGMAERLLPGGCLVTADLARGADEAAYGSLLEVWFRLMKTADITDEQIEAMRVAYRQNVALLPVAEVRAIITTGGFDTPVQFLQTGLIHAWYAQRLSVVE